MIKPPDADSHSQPNTTRLGLDPFEALATAAEHVGRLFGSCFLGTKAPQAAQPAPSASGGLQLPGVVMQPTSVINGAGAPPFSLADKVKRD